MPTIKAESTKLASAIALMEAREAAGLTQRELGKWASIPLTWENERKTRQYVEIMNVKEHKFGSFILYPSRENLEVKTSFFIGALVIQDYFSFEMKYKKDR